MVLYRMFMSPRKIVSVRDEAYSRGSIRHQNRLLLLLLIAGLASWPFSVEVAVFLSIISAACLGINFMLCIMDDEDDVVFNANGLGSDYIFKSDIVEVPRLNISMCYDLGRIDPLAWQDICKVYAATKKANKSINRAVRCMCWGDIRDKVMWAQEEQKHLNAHTEEFAYYLSRSLRPNLSEPRNIIRTTLRNYADSLNEMADDIDKIVEDRMRDVRTPLGVCHCYSGVEGDTEDTMGESVTSGADTGTLWSEDDF